MLAKYMNIGYLDKRDLFSKCPHASRSCLHSPGKPLCKFSKVQIMLANLEALLLGMTRAGLGLGFRSNEKLLSHPHSLAEIGKSHDPSLLPTHTHKAKYLHSLQAHIYVYVYMYIYISEE